MRLIHCAFYIILLYITIIYSAEYLYPVASLNNGAIIFFIHQLSSDKIELFEWDTKKNIIEQSLWSLYNPTAIQLLPNRLGFSFIDNGRLRIKLFNKRSPKAIDFDIPIFNLNIIEWINENKCYCSAQLGDNYAIFQLDISGAVEKLVSSDNADCLYPQKVDSFLFYIERNKRSDYNGFIYNIAKTAYTTKLENQSENIMSFDNKPIIFLNMQSPKEGFVIEHAKNIETNDTTMTFLYHHIQQKGSGWQKRLLFSFVIPSSLLIDVNNQALYESILPLLPRVINNKVYFVTSEHSSCASLELYHYDLTSEMTKEYPISNYKGHLFVPVSCGKHICIGGTKQKSNVPIFIF